MRPRILFLSGRETAYIRNRVLLKALRASADVEVLTPRVPGTVARIAVGLARLPLRRTGHDLLFAGFYGQPIAIGAAHLQQRPILLDAYVSTFDTLCHDRHWFRPESAGGRIARWLDARSSALARRVLTDTRAHAGYFAGTFAVPRTKIDVVYVSCDDSVFFPSGHGPRSQGVGAAAGSSLRFEVFTYGSYLPLHGTEIVVQAAALLRDLSHVHFVLGGDGPGRPRVQRLVRDLALSNVDMCGWIPFDHLPHRIAAASLCLGGHFSAVPKAARVVSTKTYQFLAMGKPTIVGDNPATRELLVHGEHAWAVPMGDPCALAAAIRTLAGDPPLCRHLGEGGGQLYRERLALPVLAELLRGIVEASL